MLPTARTNREAGHRKVRFDIDPATTAGRGAVRPHAATGDADSPPPQITVWSARVELLDSSTGSAFTLVTATPRRRSTLVVGQLGQGVPLWDSSENGF